MVTVVVIEFSDMRCQPLRRALAEVKKNHKIPCSFFLSLRL